MGRLQRNRAQMGLELAGTWRRRYFSPAALSLHEGLRGPLSGLSGGTLLDVGAGAAPSRADAPQMDRYLALDIDGASPGIDIVADARSLPIAGSAIDAVLCSQVLEHVRDPNVVLAETWRVLRPGGQLVITVPLLARLHDVPDDYFRFTEYGLLSLLRGAGFEVRRVAPSGSLACFLGHQVSTVLVGGTWHLPLIRDLVFWINAAIIAVPCYWLDRVFGLQRRMPLNYVAVATKPRGLPEP